MSKKINSLSNNKIFFLSYLLSMSFLALSCNTLNLQDSDGNVSKEELDSMTNDPQKRFKYLESSVAQLKFEMKNLAQDYEMSKKIISSLQNDVQSQSEEIATQRKNMDILKRGLRSGLFEDVSEDPIMNKTKNSKSTMLPDFVNGRTGFTEMENSIDIKSNGKHLNTNDIVGPKQLIASAEIKIRKAEYKNGLLELDELKKKFPNFEDGGRSFLLSAEAWVKLKEYDNVLPEIRSFYLKYPTSADLAYAKLLEGQAYEGNGSFEKAATLYNEVISLSPQSSLSQSARNGMLRMSDQK